MKTNILLLFLLGFILGCSPQKYNTIPAKNISNSAISTYLSKYFNNTEDGLLVSTGIEQIDSRAISYKNTGAVNNYLISVRVPYEIYNKKNQLIKQGVVQEQFFSSYNDSANFQDDLITARQDMAFKLANNIIKKIK